MPKKKIFNIGSQDKKSKILSEIYEWVGLISFVLVIFTLLFSFVFREVGVQGNSMNNTLYYGDRLIIRSIFYSPQKDDIVVIYVKKLHKTIVKRVIAVGGQTVNIDYTAHRVYVDGVLQNEPFISQPTAFMGELPVKMPVKVPKDCIFVMGDNRNYSKDSRSMAIGMIDIRNVLGKVIFRYFPLSNMKIIN